MGLKYDRIILIGAPIGLAVIVATFIGMDKLFKSPTGRSWVMRNLGLLLAIFVILQIILFIWDRIVER